MSLICLQKPTSAKLLVQGAVSTADARQTRVHNGLAALPTELWQLVLSHLPISTFWGARAVCLSWKTYIEAYLLRVLLRETWLILQVDTRPSFDFYGVCIPHRRVDDARIVYALPERTRAGWWGYRPGSERTRMARDGRSIVVGNKTYGMMVSIAGYLAGAPKARRVQYDEKTREVCVDWRVLLCTMFDQPTFQPRDLHLSELMHRPGRPRGSHASTL